MHDFDEIIERRSWGSFKWNAFGPDVLPMFVADMDFLSPPQLVAALQKRVAHGIFGYQYDAPDTYEIICKRMEELYNWKVDPNEIILLPGLVPGINFACRAVGATGDAALIMPPVYPPFFTAPRNQGLSLQTAQVKPHTVNQSIIRYEIDLDAIKQAITPETKLLILCSPHNPVGRIFTANELREIVKICVDHDLIICSDEIHCDFVLGNGKHTPTASLSKEAANRCITLMAPNKAFNIAGLNTGFAIVQNKELKKKFERAEAGLAPAINCLAVTALKAAYSDCGEWLQELQSYLTINRDFVVDYVMKNMPGVKTTSPEATYLAWLDCREVLPEANTYKFFLNEAKVALGNGSHFGPGGEGFVRLNFGCPKSQLREALERMNTALKKRAG